MRLKAAIREDNCLCVIISNVQYAWLGDRPRAVLVAVVGILPIRGKSRRTAIVPADLLTRQIRSRHWPSLIRECCGAEERREGNANTSSKRY
jgi:hypothetical protein